MSDTQMAHPHYPLYIAGAFCDGSASHKKESFNPADGTPWATFACATAADVDRAVDNAKRALNDPAWRS